MQRVGLVLKRDEQAVILGQRINRFLKEAGIEVLLETSCQELNDKWDARSSENLADEVDLLVVLGGDGTILRAASLLNSKSIPVLGINLGRVGFMAEVSPDEAISELQSVMDGAALFVKRMMLEVTMPGAKTARVLNDVVIHWAGIARLIDLGIRFGNAKELELRADGLIVATPTGSSAYSFAANGPLAHPDIEGILLTPICPYAGLKRPLIIPPDMETQLILKRGETFRLTLDGHTTISLDQGESLRIKRSPLPFVIVQSRARNYFDVLKQKLGLL
jgi:NAD+ kinase